MVDAQPQRSSPAELLALGLGPGLDDAAFEDTLDLGAFLCNCPELELHGCLGRGGMGVVYRARQVRLDRDVAVKLMSPEVARDPEFADRFELEAKAMARLHHPGIVSVHDFGHAAGVYYIVMELVDGPNLRQLMGEPMSEVQASDIVGQLCDALGYAHDHGVVHRDIKPENVLLDRSGRVRIADFGLAKLQREHTQRTAIQTRRVLGTPQYMAPEQIRDPGSVDHRSDIFAVGVVFYEMLTGQLPVGRFQPPSELGRSSARLDEVVLRALESSRERRFQAASELHAALSMIASDTETSTANIGTSRRLWWATGLAAAAGAAIVAWRLGRAPVPADETATPAATVPATGQVDPSPPQASVNRDRWPARELGLLDPSVAGVVGLDWSQLRQAPAIRRLGNAAFGGDAALADRCEQALVHKTNKILVGVATDGRPVDILAHADWELDTLEDCLQAGAMSFGRDRDETPLQWHSEPFGPFRKITIKADEGDHIVTMGKRGSTIAMTLRRVTEAQLDAMLAGETTSTELRERVLTTLDLAAPIWVFAKPDPALLPFKMTGFHGTIDVWERVSVDATVTFVDAASAASAKTLAESYANVFASLPDVAQPPEIKIDHTGNQLHGRASFDVPKLGGDADVQLGDADVQLGVSLGKAPG